MEPLFTRRFRCPRQPLLMSDWEAYLRSLPYVSVAEAAAGDGLLAAYENPLTEVEFELGFCQGDPAPELTVTLAALRSAVYAIEAAPLVVALAARFDLELESEAGFAVPTVESLCAAFVAASAAAHRGLDAQRVPSLPFASLERVWRWNRARPEVSARHELPALPVWFCRDGEGDRIVAAATWVHGAPAALPEVEAVFVWRGEAPVRIAGLEVAHALADLPLRGGALSYRCLSDVAAIAALTGRVAALPALAALPARLPLAALHDQARWQR